MDRALAERRIDDEVHLKKIGLSENPLLARRRNNRNWVYITVVALSTFCPIISLHIYIMFHGVQVVMPSLHTASTAIVDKRYTLKICYVFGILTGNAGGDGRGRGCTIVPRMQHMGDWYHGFGDILGLCKAMYPRVT